MKVKNKIDMIHGPLFGKIWIFTIPIMLSGILQLLFNSADMIVVGRAVGETALAAVGCTTAVINLLINLFIGFSVGSSVVVAQLSGAGRDKDVSDAVHTSLLISFIGGLVLGVLGISFSPAVLKMLGTPKGIMDMAIAYVRIYFCGLPAVGIYNFGSSILRAVGETRKPMIYLLISCITNICLNLLFVMGFGWGIAGVAWATVISQTLSATFVILCLIRSNGSIKFSFKKLKINKKRLVSIMSIGIPAGIQGSLFSISNAIIQTAVNSFGGIAIAANTAATNVGDFAYMALNGFSQAAITFTGQNIGAYRWDRVKRVLGACSAALFISGSFFSIALILFGEPLLTIYNTDPQVIKIGLERIYWVGTMQIICGYMEMMAGMMRGMGKSVTPTIVSLIGVCVFRVIWMSTIFTKVTELWVVFLSYPVSWVITTLAHFVCYIAVYNNNLKIWNIRQMEMARKKELYSKNI